jgi:hypothetical protein
MKSQVKSCRHDGDAGFVVAHDGEDDGGKLAADVTHGGHAEGVPGGGESARPFPGRNGEDADEFIGGEGEDFVGGSVLGDQFQGRGAVGVGEEALVLGEVTWVIRKPLPDLQKLPKSGEDFDIELAGGGCRPWQEPQSLRSLISCHG